MNLEELLNNKKLDVLQILFNAIAEDLAIITKDDKSNLEIVDSQLNYQYQKLKSTKFYIFFKFFCIGILNFICNFHLINVVFLNLPLKTRVKYLK